MTTQQPLISVVIVSYKVKNFTVRCLDSLYKTEGIPVPEIIVVDNDSKDGTVECLREDFPQVNVIRNEENAGFGRACNQGMKISGGKYVLFLNPDTLVEKDTLKILSDFLEENEKAGMVGPKILNPDGSLQLACRRSFPTPSSALSRFLGLSRLFPKSKKWGRYNLTYLDENQTMEIDAVSGSCMMIRKEVLEKTGGFDEDFFMYGEDLDLCYRIKALGQKVFYCPRTKIVHFKGESAQKKPYRSFIAFQYANYIFSRKHITEHFSFIPKWFLNFGILINSAFQMVQMIMRHPGFAVADLFFLNSILAVVIFAWYRVIQIPSPYDYGNFSVIFLHLIFSVVWLVSLAANGAYSGAKKDISNTFRGCLTGGIVSLATVYLARDLAFSRVAFLITSGLSTFLIPGWRILLFRYRSFQQSSVLLIGSHDLIRRGIIVLNKKPFYSKVYYLSEKQDPEQGNAEYLGKPEEISMIVREVSVDEVIVFQQELSYTKLIETIAISLKKKPVIRLATFSREQKLILADLATPTIQTL